MSQDDLDTLERDVEAARNRVAGDVARLRKPAIVADFKNDVTSKALSLKDELVQQASDTASGTAQRVWSDLKGRARANPGAVFAIGAGLAWHLARHPPITTVLVGLGLTSLMRTDPLSEESPIVTRATELAGTVQETAREWSAEGREAIATAAEKAREWSTDGREAIETAADKAREWSADGREAIATAAEKARQWTGEAAETLSHASSRVADLAQDSGRRLSPYDSQVRDSYLLGVATLAIGAAAVISMKRGAD
jgi:hypothetical protein